MAYSHVDVWDLPSPESASISVDRRAVRTPVDSGMVQRKQTLSSESDQGVAAVRTFTLNYRFATKGHLDKLMALWVNTSGGTQGIQFTNIFSPYTGSSETILVRMKAAPLDVRKVNHVRWAFSVVLEEMLHGPGV